jgi:hypothetical protein
MSEQTVTGRLNLARSAATDELFPDQGPDADGLR